jgi:hypothetical protein
VGEKESEPFQFTFNGFLKVAFQGSRVTSDAGNGANVVTFRPGGVDGPGVGTTFAKAMALLAAIPGYKLLAFDDSIVTPCVIPAGAYDMTEVEWTAFIDRANTTGIAVSVSDGVQLTWPAIKIGGDLTITNHCTSGAPFVLPVGTTLSVMELGTGFTGDYPTITNAGTSPFLDLSNLGTGIFIMRSNGQITGANPAIALGASSGSFGWGSAQGFARLAANMITGSNAAATLAIGKHSSGAFDAYQPNFAGNVIRTNAGLSNMPTPQLQILPQGLLQTNPIPSVVPIAAPLHSSCLLLNASALTQVLPQIRNAAVTTGTSPLTMGSMDSTGMITVVKNKTGVGAITVSAFGTETIEGVNPGAISVAAGKSVMFMSDGVSDWSIIAQY